MTVKNLMYELKMERDRVEKQLKGLNAALSAFAETYAGAKTTVKTSRKRPKLSAQGRARIAAAQRARWAKIKAKKKAA